MIDPRYVELWLRAAFAHVSRTARNVWRWTTWNEVAHYGATWLLTVLVGIGLATSTGPADGLAILTFVLMIGWSVTGAALMVQYARERWQHHAASAALLTDVPSGAPRMASVPCSEGRIHRIVYSGNEWREAGPSTEVFPDAPSRMST
jgi:hypothetical protein